MTTLGVAREWAQAECRVALDPGTVERVQKLGVAVAVATGAGGRAHFADSAYRETGAEILSENQLYERADIMVTVGPSPHADRLRSGTYLLGILDPWRNAELVRQCAQREVTALSLDLLPRKLSRAQPMDALTSQANIAGYKAAVLAADTYGHFFPMLSTAAGTTRPAAVLVLGAGVAGLSAISTARRLGAVVTGYDIRPQARDDVRSLGARFLDLSNLPDGATEGGYARQLTAQERRAQQEALQDRISAFDVVITTAQVPGCSPPMMMTAEAVKSMRPGSVVIDLAAGPQGGNVEGSVAGQRLVIDDAVTLIGAGDLPSAMAPAASTAYAHNIAAVLAHFVRDGQPVIDLGDEILGALVLTHGGRIVHPDFGEPQ
jgi:NAD(P) transhydrogenase subunit alpha